MSDLLPALLGIALGLGVLLAVQGFRGLVDRSRPEAERRQAMWKLNAGIVLAGISMYAFTLVTRG